MRIKINTCLFQLACSILLFSPALYAQEPEKKADDLELKVVEIFTQNCALATCHTGPTPQMSMDLSKDQYYASTVGEPSVENPNLKRVNPGEPETSYLLKKVKGDPDIIGARMPFNKEKLPDDQIQTIEQWIRSLDSVDEERKKEAKAEKVYPFLGWRNINLPTARTLDKGNWLFLISHRFNPPLSDGVDALYGLDGSSIIYLSFGYAFTDNFLVALGRSNASDDVELHARYRVARQEKNGGSPIGLSVQGALNWISEKPNDPGEDRLRSEVLKLTLQASLTRKFLDQLSFAVVPGILINPDETSSDEDVYVSIGLSGRWNFHKRLSLIGEWVPVISGFERTTTFGNPNRFDSWGTGLEIATGGHVFQVVLSNSVGITTDQYILGGDLDPTDFFKGDIRLGFNIFRVVNFKK